MTSTCSASATALPAAIHAFSLMPRRGFLAGLARLPLIGGSVALVGRPRGVAESATPDMLEAYKTWLEYERRSLSWEMAGDPLWRHRYRNFAEAGDRVALSDEIDHSFTFVGRSHAYQADASAPSTRAALVLSAVGCDWREDKAHTAERRA